MNMKYLSIVGSHESIFVNYNELLGCLKSSALISVGFGSMVYNIFVLLKTPAWGMYLGKICWKKDSSQGQATMDHSINNQRIKRIYSMGKVLLC